MLSRIVIVLFLSDHAVQTRKVLGLRRLLTTLNQQATSLKGTSQNSPYLHVCLTLYIDR